MLKKHLIIAIFLIGFINKSFSQDFKNYQDINDIWSKFCQAFDSLDYQLMAEIHSKNLIRIPNGKRIVDYDSYIEKYKTDFELNKKENSTITISLRFYERINNDSIASERGVYKTVVNKNQSEEKTFYGKFHVLLIKVKGNWKILMDYDSNEGKKVGEKDFIKAFEMSNLNKFIKE